MKTNIARANQNGSITAPSDSCSPYNREAMVIPTIMNRVKVRRKKSTIALLLAWLRFLESWAFIVSQGDIKIGIPTNAPIR